ncbi:unnamed protein product, partial [marine sediment metagenome]
MPLPTPKELHRDFVARADHFKAVLDAIRDGSLHRDAQMIGQAVHDLDAAFKSLKSTATNLAGAIAPPQFGEPRKRQQPREEWNPEREGMLQALRAPYSPPRPVYLRKAQKTLTPQAVQPRNLPIVMINDQEFYRDTQLGEYRNVRNPHLTYPFHEVTVDDRTGKYVRKRG